MPLKTKASCTPFGARFVHPCFQRILYLPMLSTFRTAFFFDCLSWLLRNYNFVSAVPQIQMATDGFGRHRGWVQVLCFETTFTRVSLFFASIINTTIAATSRSRYTVPIGAGVLQTISSLSSLMLVVVIAWSISCSRQRDVFKFCANHRFPRNHAPLGGATGRTSTCKTISPLV